MSRSLLPALRRSWLGAFLAMSAASSGCSSAEPAPAPAPAPRPQPAAVAVSPQAAAPPPRADGPTDPRLEEFAREVHLAHGEERVLAAIYVRSARARMEELRYEDAAKDLERASALDPENVEARRLLDRVHVADPHGPRDYRGTIDALAEERQAKEEQERVDVKRLFSEGELLLEKQRYDDAIRYFERVLEMIKWSPSADPGTFEARTRAALASARSLAR